MFAKEGTRQIPMGLRGSTDSSRKRQNNFKSRTIRLNSNSSLHNQKASQTNDSKEKAMNEIRNDIQECEPENDAIQIVIPDQLMAKAVLPPKPLPSPDTLPKVSYRVLPEPPPHVFKTFWVHPRSYIRFPEWTPEEVGSEDEKVEYEMDSEDELWLREYNETHQSTSGKIKLTEEEFEYIVDRLEKQAFLHSRDFLQRTEQLVQSACCAVCGDGTSDDTNQIVLCDGCDVAVHQNCYGVRLIPEGEWRCALCENGLGPSQTCAFCGYNGGAQKPTTKPNEWVHVQCALWLEETGFTDPDCFGPVQYFKEIPPERRQLECYICHKIRGAPIQCANENCTHAFHVTCAQRKHLAVVIEEDLDRKIVYRAWCVRHTPSFYRESLRMKTEEEKRKREEERQRNEELRFSDHGSRRNKSRRQSWNFLHKDSDFVWDEDFEALAKRRRRSSRASEYFFEENFEALKYCAGLKFSEVCRHIKIVSSTILCSVYKYWMEKRQKRRGFPLLKRFQPSVLTSLVPVPPPSIKEMSFHELRRGVNLLKTVRYQLEILRDSLTLIRRRERIKLKLLKIQKSLFEMNFMPLLRDCRQLLKFFRAQDVLNIFKEPVSSEKVPDYYDVIKNPMDFQTMKNKIDDQKYETEKQFIDDLLLVFNNAKVYNHPETIFHKEGDRLLKLFTALQNGESCEPFLAENSLDLKVLLTTPKKKRGRPPKYTTNNSDMFCGEKNLISLNNEKIKLTSTLSTPVNRQFNESTSTSMDSNKELSEEEMKDNTMSGESRMETTTGTPMTEPDDDEDFSGDESVARERQRIKQMNAQKQNVSTLPLKVTNVSSSSNDFKNNNQSFVEESPYKKRRILYSSNDTQNKNVNTSNCSLTLNK